MNEKMNDFIRNNKCRKKERIDMQELQKRRIQIQQKKNKSHDSQ